MMKKTLSLCWAETGLAGLNDVQSKKNKVKSAFYSSAPLALRVFTKNHSVNKPVNLWTFLKRTFLII